MVRQPASILIGSTEFFSVSNGDGMAQSALIAGQGPPMMSLLWRFEGLYGDSFVATQRSEIHVPVNLGFYGLATQDGYPIGYFTYAMASEEVILNAIQGRLTRLTNEADWCSGDNMWIVSAVSPYEAAGFKMTRYIVQSMPLSIRKARTLRLYRGPGGERRKPRIVEWYRQPETDKVLVRTYSVDDLISDLKRSIDTSGRS